MTPLTTSQILVANNFLTSKTHRYPDSVFVLSGKHFPRIIEWKEFLFNTTHAHMKEKLTWCEMEKVENVFQSLG